MTSYSIVEARNQFSALVRDAEENNQAIQITRHGHPVAVILSVQEYGRLLAHQPKRGFWASYQEWRQKWNVSELDMDPDEIWVDVRDFEDGKLVG